MSDEIKKEIQDNYLEHDLHTEKDPQCSECYKNRFQFHEKWKNPSTGRYKKHIYTLDGKPLMGITSVLGIIAKPALINWAAKKTVEYIKDNYEGELTEELLDNATSAHSDFAESAADRGTEIHKGVEEYIKSKIAGITYSTKDKAVQSFIDWAEKENVKFIASEKKLYSEKLWLAGTCDIVFEKDGKRFVGDVKTYAKIWDRIPFFQMAGYVIMLEEMGEKIDGGCIININKETNERTIEWSLNMEEDKKSFLSALQIYNTKDFN